MKETETDKSAVNVEARFEIRMHKFKENSMGQFVFLTRLADVDIRATIIFKVIWHL